MAAQHHQRPNPGRGQGQGQFPPAHTTSKPPARPRCTVCGGAEQWNKLLVQCIHCDRYYHPSHDQSTTLDLFVCHLCFESDWVKRFKQTRKQWQPKRHDGTNAKLSAQIRTQTTTTSSSSAVPPEHVANVNAKATTNTTNQVNMFSAITSTGNPFLSDDEDDSYWVKTKCRVPNCDKDTAQGHLACSFHLQSSISPKSSKGLDTGPSQAPSQPSDAQADLAPSPNRKILDAKFTIRKSAARQTRQPFKPADARVNHTLSAQNRLSNGHAKTSLQRPLAQASPDIPARKRQRVLSPRNDDSGFDSAPSASPLALPPGFIVQNADSNIPHPLRLPTLNGGNNPFVPGVAKVQERPARVLSSYGDYLKSPLTETFGLGSNILRNSSNGITNRAHRANSSPRPVPRNVSLEVPQNQITSPLRAPPPKATPSKTRTSQSERISPSQYPKLKSIARTTPLEKHRRRLVEQGSSSLDAFVYGQPGSSQPPPGIERRREDIEPKKQQEVFYAHIDPRTHRSRPHSEAWYQKKEEDIKARGGRKANFGKAVQRMREERLKERPEDFEASLPDRVRHNENWVSALRWFEGEGRSVGAAQSITPVTPVRTKRPYKRRQPIAQPTPEKKVSAQDL